MELAVATDLSKTSQSPKLLLLYNWRLAGGHEFGRSEVIWSLKDVQLQTERSCRRVRGVSAFVCVYVIVLSLRLGR